MSKGRLKTSCLLCKGFSVDETSFGKVFQNGKWAVHHFCMLFTNCCEQNGDDDEGYEGFLLKDIVKAARQNEKNRCDYCGRRGANIKCQKKSCKKFFHTNCGLKNDCNFQFRDAFPVYCPKHSEIKFKEDRQLDAKCGICFDSLVKKKSILIPCCKNSWFHRNCLQKYATVSGYYHFKCPLCADRTKCIEELPKIGIFVPIADAQWELDNDFEDMTAPPHVICEFCDSSEGAEENHLWKMCEICGASGVHWRCLDQIESQSFICRHCHEILEKKESQPKPKTPRKKKRTSDGGYPVLFLASDEELCTTSDNEEDNKQGNSHRNCQSTSGSSSGKENQNSKGETCDSSDEEILKPNKSRKKVILDESSSDSSDEEIVSSKNKRRKKIIPESSDEEDEILPKRKRMRVLSSSPETPKNKSRFSTYRL